MPLLWPVICSASALFSCASPPTCSITPTRVVAELSARPVLCSIVVTSPPSSVETPTIRRRPSPASRAFSDPDSTSWITADIAETLGSAYRLWTTLKVPQGYSIERHCDYLAEQIGALSYRAMPAKALFALGVGHLRRRNTEPGARSDEPGEMITAEIVTLDARDWQVMTALKRELEPHEITPDLWRPRADEAGVSLDEFYTVAESLHERGLLGRFSTFLEHSKPLPGGERVTRYNALFHWAVTKGREIDAGIELGRHHIMTHAYWRDAGPEFGNVNVMGVAHASEDKQYLLEHKAAIDAHLEEAGIEISYSNVFWGGRSKIKPSEFSPVAYREWCTLVGIDAESMRATG